MMSSLKFRYASLFNSEWFWEGLLENYLERSKMAAILLINFITTPSDTRLPAYLFMYKEE
jgi:hypothetical protein